MDPSAKAKQNPLGLKRIAMLFSGGPAPAANAVISTAAVSFLRHNVEVLGILNGYSHLTDFRAEAPLEEGQHYLRIDHKALKRTRNSRGILIGTARANPGKNIDSYDDLKDAKKAAPLRATYDALRSLGVDALISIGGDDTLKTANKFARFQAEQLAPGEKRIRVVHIPKTIDNDYAGIDFTFGYFTAVEQLAGEIRNLVADAEATRSYYLAECMGRYAGWLAYGAAIAGEASLVLSVEDMVGDFVTTEVDSVTKQTRKIMNFEKVVGRIVDIMVAREKEGKAFGVLALAEGLAELLPSRYVEGVPRDEHGHLSIANVNFAKVFAKLVAEEYKTRTGKTRKVTGVTLGYEARCAAPQAFDVLLGSALGVGAFRALYEEGQDEVMISVLGQMDLRYVPFDTLIDPKTMKTNTRYIERDSDFHKLARFLETYAGE
jgi:6-phosphofructokinase 1